MSKDLKVKNYERFKMTNKSHSRIQMSKKEWINFIDIINEKISNRRDKTIMDYCMDLIEEESGKFN